ncbi:sigma 54-interacting transcriptional regulator [Paraburkholderia sp. UCT2]|uniref:sigma 54-interacting transcriptional regulator n=1 Tax=Paraburkholderia sp. UCT2 TaxID=2615208 RepID=UPI00223A9217|nr:sigma-54 dependent transcriptional regulator [Paraburkholderia sp. UCT2]
MPAGEESFPMIGSSQSFLEAQRVIERFARCDVPVLIEGETGTGKELAARAIHYGGQRSSGPFVPVNCGALPDALVDNELFGHKRGAFTDAHIEQAGLIAHASGGTLFLDEVDALPLKSQVILLRFLQDHQYRPLGAPESRHADVRLIAATNADLAERVEEGEFRLDLLFRLRILVVTLPPLRERDRDIELLADNFLHVCAQRFGNGDKVLHPATFDWMYRYDWPGNIRELETLICRGYLLSDARVIEIGPPDPFISDRCQPGIVHLQPASLYGSLRQLEAPAMLAHEDFKTAKSRVITEFECRYLADALSAAGGNVTKAARIAGKERRAFGKLLKKHGLAPAQSAFDGPLR